MATEQLLPPHGNSILKRIIQRLDAERAHYNLSYHHLIELCQNGTIRTDISKDIERLKSLYQLKRECVLEVESIREGLVEEMEKSGIRYAI